MKHFYQTQEIVYDGKSAVVKDVWRTRLTIVVGGEEISVSKSDSKIKENGN